MIHYQDGVFRLTTQKTGYWFRVTSFKHLKPIFYGSGVTKKKGLVQAIGDG